MTPSGPPRLRLEWCRLGRGLGLVVDLAYDFEFNYFFFLTVAIFFLIDPPLFSSI